MKFARIYKRIFFLGKKLGAILRQIAKGKKKKKKSECWFTDKWMLEFHDIN
jgi:hypothetical protein